MSGYTAPGDGEVCGYNWYKLYAAGEMSIEPITYIIIRIIIIIGIIAGSATQSRNIIIIIIIVSKVVLPGRIMLDVRKER